MIPAYIKPYFWEADTKKLDPKKYPEYVISRVLEYGDKKSAGWMIKTFDRNVIRKVIINSHGLSPRSANFWGALFDVSKNKILCLKKSYQKRQKLHWPY
ncbi:MAG: hypothetical protein UX06_C0045G0003 [Candidatus Giovannonibacteria bacterium GW2011_GWA2_45_21]|uniref:DUF6922 domain-containing protein n=1 Tax=Candidatus Giovannonibacteria bacterium GW2011_GWA2_45_21 TaxID=1618649 RepID=A0A0G1M4Z0_9BACT|nr:MAG: hypothetical protein UX06_C0045G0003 [Candidatus Giovannonibacteria bacterium GW2011_GWA2_45_21]